MDKEDILKHRKLFNEWLDGESIQFYYEPEKTWINVDNPSWDKDIEYRIKPHKIGFEGCEFNEIEYKVNEIGDIIEVEIDKLEIDSNKIKSTLFQDKKIAEAYAVLPKLIRLRDKYNEGWKPDWKCQIEIKYSIRTYNNKLDLDNSYSTNRILTFKDSEVRARFFEQYRDLIEIAKPLL